MLKKIVIGLGAAVALLIFVILLQPSRFRIERSIEMAAPPEAAFAQVNTFHAWSKWSPWEKLDPNLKRTFDGPAAGAGAKYAWAGNRDVGEGRMTIEKSNAPSELRIKLEFLKPFSATNTAVFTFAETAGGNKTTWAMEGENNFIAKAMHLVMDMDALLGPDFEKGLAAMRDAAEQTPRTPVANVAP